MKSAPFSLVLAGILIIGYSSLYSQPKKGMYGITAAISKGFESTQNIRTNNGSMGIGVSFMPAENLNLRGELGFRTHKDTSGGKESEFTFSGNLWYYLQTSESVSTFLGGGIGFGSSTDAGGRGTSLASFSAYFGGEYWVSPHFSCFGHIGVVYLAYTVAERPASDVFTSATIGLNWYF
jgi:hypothetical protein